MNLNFVEPQNQRLVKGDKSLFLEQQIEQNKRLMMLIVMIMIVIITMIMIIMILIIIINNSDNNDCYNDNGDSNYQ